MITIGDFKLSNPVMNAACSIAKTPNDVKQMCTTKAGAVLVGSITVEQREGNPYPRWQDEGGYALNSFGMPNKGLKYYAVELPKMVRVVHDADKLFVLSIAGFKKSDYKKLARLAEVSKVDLLELNFGCPNAREESGIASFDINYMKDVIEEVQSSVDVPLMVKLSPYSDPVLLGRVANMLAKTKVVAVVTSNSFPNGYMQSADSNQSSHYGGVVGRALFPVGIGQVKQFRSLLPKHVSIVGVGGIESKKDVKAYINAGADAVQVSTYIVRNGHAAVDNLIGV